MAAYDSSIVIPVFNKWDLTRNCLKSLAETVDKNRVEVIVTDNGSTDVTPKACTFLGEKLFGKSFTYIRNEQNRNFAGASNQGAEAASGNYLIFLNNDTITTPGWHDPLLNDFTAFPNLGATGPLLLYPQTGTFGHTVQHLGVFVSPFKKFGHLYQNIPAASRLATERRFFQAITAACMVIRRDLFMQAGRFDEAYKNGFEDINLCGRLAAKGYRFTVNPASRVLHCESQTSGRNLYLEANSLRLSQTSHKFFHPDWHLLLKEDGLKLTINEWLRFQPRLSPHLERELDAKLPDMDLENLRKAIVDNLYWQKGWEKYLQGMRGTAQFPENFGIYFNFCPTLANAERAIELGRQYGNKPLQALGRNALMLRSSPPEALLEQAVWSREKCENNGVPELAAQYEQWIRNYGHFRDKIYPEQARLFPQVGTEKG